MSAVLLRRSESAILTSFKPIAARVVLMLFVLVGDCFASDHSVSAEAVQACDGLASAPWDPDAPDRSRTVEFRDLRAGPAATACQAAIAQAPHLRRLYFQLGRAYDRQGANQDAYQAYRRASDLGSGAAKVNIGILFRQGRRFEKNDTKARSWFREAAEAGIPEGMFCYATAFDNAIGGASDIAAAKLWYGKAAERGTTKARDALVRLELNGVGTGARCD
ncbi:tetratricopeptide repeat protein [Methylobacterium sp. J-067]|uniref:tetratricopeptide repeat protein n=1 Tax=Methylobacterium sp. J-067 TaxID=2836648 RepID=UPI001FBBDD16|nr:tetratricopeptide repeat protein [Methylobacterium sp. J-067]MCJ2026332.1 sel1 repeat family protein [Methylobacterium sp. J-067]